MSFYTAFMEMAIKVERHTNVQECVPMQYTKSYPGQITPQNDEP